MVKFRIFIFGMMKVWFFLLPLVALSCLKDDGLGCMDPTATNYDPQAVSDDGSCFYGGDPLYQAPNFSGSFYTSFSENWDDWDFQFNGLSGSLYTSFSENWDDWDFSIGGINGSITTSFSENWDDWNLTTSDYSLSISTSYSENWDDWDIDDDNSSWYASVSTSYSENWDDWDASADSVDMDFYTSYSENWDDWDFSGYFKTSNPLEYKVAVVFVPLIVTVLRQQGIIP